MDKRWAICWKLEIQFTPCLGIRSSVCTRCASDLAFLCTHFQFFGFSSLSSAARGTTIITVHLSATRFQFLRHLREAPPTSRVLLCSIKKAAIQWLTDEYIHTIDEGGEEDAVEHADIQKGNEGNYIVSIDWKGAFAYSRWKVCCSPILVPSKGGSRVLWLFISCIGRSTH